MSTSTRPSRIVRLGDALSQFANVMLLNGDANESISGRAHREDWSSVERVINALFSPFEADHCRSAYLADVMRAKKLIEDHDGRN